MKAKLFKATSQNMSYVIEKTPLNKHQLKELNLLKILCIQAKSSKGHRLAFLLMGKAREVNMPLINTF